MKNLKHYFYLSLMSVLLIGCAQQRSMTVRSDVREDVDMSNFQTYNWISEDGEMRRNQYGNQNSQFGQNGQTNEYGQNQQNMQNNQNQQDTLNRSSQMHQGNQGQSGQMQQDAQGQNNQFGQQTMNVYSQLNKKSIKEAIDTQLQAKGFTKESNNPDLLVSYIVVDQPTQLRTFTRGNYSYVGDGPAGADVEMVEVQPGAVIVNFADAETGMQVWQGFASTALEESDLKDDDTVKAKIAAIFEQFDFSGFSFGSNQGTTGTDN